MASKRKPPQGRRHGTCQHQWADGRPYLRCGMVRGGRRPVRKRRKRGHVSGAGARGRNKSFETATPECVPKPLRRSLLARFVGLFKKGR